MEAAWPRLRKNSPTLCINLSIDTIKLSEAMFMEMIFCVIAVLYGCKTILMLISEIIDLLKRIRKALTEES